MRITIEFDDWEVVLEDNYPDNWHRPRQAMSAHLKLLMETVSEDWFKEKIRREIEKEKHESN